MGPSEYIALYALQDEVLEMVFKEPSGFYLTGGTALSRYYLNHRYSDDLDFFDHDIAVFPDAFRLIYRKLMTRWPDISLEVDARDFKRLHIRHEKALLKLDFIADRVDRTGLPVMRDGVYVDTVRNILGNKLCAILGRDEGRDIADLIYISRAYRFSWKTILTDVSAKEDFQLEDLSFRIKTFPVETLAAVPFIARKSLNEYASDLEKINRDMSMHGENSLAEYRAIEL